VLPNVAQTLPRPKIPLKKNLNNLPNKPTKKCLNKMKKGNLSLISLINLQIPAKMSCLDSIYKQIPTNRKTHLIHITINKTFK
jgi:hypothetical protein